MPSINEIVARYRAEMAAEDKARIRDLARAYAQIARDLQPIIDDAIAALERAEARGSTLSAAYQRAFFERMEADALRRLETLSRTMYRRLERERQAAIDRGQRMARELTDEILGAGGGFDPRGIGIQEGPLVSLLGALSKESPLARLLLNIAGDGRGSALAVAGAKAAAEALIRAVSLALSPRAIAREVRDALGTNLTRALTIARTETLRAQRSSSIATYSTIPEVTGWVWISARDKRTCAACWAMHGRFFPFDRATSAQPPVDLRTTTEAARVEPVPAAEDGGVDWGDEELNETPRDIALQAWMSGDAVDMMQAHARSIIETGASTGPLADETAALLREIQDQPLTSDPSWRGLGFQTEDEWKAALAQWSVGETVDIDLASFSTDRRVGELFASYSDSGPTGNRMGMLVSILGEHRRLSLEDLNPFQHEVLLSGRFRVISVTMPPPDLDVPVEIVVEAI